MPPRRTRRRVSGSAPVSRRSCPPGPRRPPRTAPVRLAQAHAGPSRSRLSSSASIAGSSRLRSASWAARHSRRSLREQARRVERGLHDPSHTASTCAGSMPRGPAPNSLALRRAARPAGSSSAIRLRADHAGPRRSAKLRRSCWLKVFAQRAGRCSAKSSMPRSSESNARPPPPTAAENAAAPSEQPSTGLPESKLLLWSASDHVRQLLPPQQVGCVQRGPCVSRRWSGAQRLRGIASPRSSRSSNGLRSSSSSTIGVHLEIGELQQLDRLPQLRRHHQRLRLPELEART